MNSDQREAAKDAALARLNDVLGGFPGSSGEFVAVLMGREANRDRELADGFARIQQELSGLGFKFRVVLDD